MRCEITTLTGNSLLAVSAAFLTIAVNRILAQTPTTTTPTGTWKVYGKVL
jgi:hypothetical protein